MQHLVSLVGMSAPPGVLQKLTYIAYQHSPDDIKQIDTVRAYSFGCEQWVRAAVQGQRERQGSRASGQVAGGKV